jgi:hypothetical protein
MDIDNIELPDNHPFAVKKKLAPGVRTTLHALKPGYQILCAWHRRARLRLHAEGCTEVSSCTGGVCFVCCVCCVCCVAWRLVPGEGRFNSFNSFLWLSGCVPGPHASAEEEAVQRSRFSARRGLSQDDLQSLKEQQALADQVGPRWTTLQPWAGRSVCVCVRLQLQRCRELRCRELRKQTGE